MTASFPIISRIALLALLLLLGGCQTRDPYADLASAPITYPFFAADEPLGQDRAGDKFIIRTISGPTEYVVEIPQAAADYDVEVPVANAPGAARNGPVKNPQITDRELVASMPKLDEKAREDQALTDKIIGVNAHGGPAQSPSYVMNIEKINQLYRDNNFEYALVEINNLLAFYPTDTKLYKMKGTILLKLGNLQLAQKSWQRASHLAPDDATIRKGLEYLQRMIERNKRVTAAEPIPMPGAALATPPPPVKPEQPAMQPTPPQQNMQPTVGYGLEPKNALNTRSRLDLAAPQQPQNHTNQANATNHANHANSANHAAPVNAANHANHANSANHAAPVNAANHANHANSVNRGGNANNANLSSRSEGGANEESAESDN